MNIVAQGNTGMYLSPNLSSLPNSIKTTDSASKDSSLSLSNNLELKTFSSVDEKHFKEIGLEHFQAVLANFGLEHAQLNVNLDELYTQESLGNNALSSFMAFDQIIQSLWSMEGPNYVGNDTLHGSILADPAAFGLSDNPTKEEVQSIILQQLKQSSNLTFSLVHINQGDNEIAGIFPPEFGEEANQYWIWMVTGSELPPGPIWGLLERDQTQGAFHYGYW